uniref:Uncharacterized protein n=1 Tax=Solanum tuberosum TaxID=4113 RepID=M1D9H7_SOLTU
MTIEFASWFCGTTIDTNSRHGEKRKEEKGEEKLKVHQERSILVVDSPRNSSYKVHQERSILVVDSPRNSSYKTQLTRIDIQRIVDPVSSSEFVDEPLYIPEDPFYLLSALDSSVGCRGPVPTSISVVLEAS